MLGYPEVCKNVMTMKGSQFIDERGRTDMKQCLDVHGGHKLPLVLARGGFCDDNSITIEEDRADTFHKSMGS